MAVKLATASCKPFIKCIVGSGGVKKDQFSTWSANTAIAATEGVASAILIGIAVETYIEGQIGSFYDVRGETLEIDVYTAGSTDDLVAADIGILYDISVDSGDCKLDLNDTTGAFLIPQEYSNTTRKAIVRVIDGISKFS
jgi:hypothetical protein